MKKIAPLLVAALASIAIVFVAPIILSGTMPNVLAIQTHVEKTSIPQQIISVNKEAKEITKIYDSGNLIGILNNQDVVEEMLNQVYKSEFEQNFPQTSIDVGKDIYIIEELSYNEYENIDNQIIQYLKDKNSFTIEVNAIDIANNEGVFATIYVDDIQKYEEALHEYLLYFVQESSLNALTSNQTVPDLTTYGERDMSVRIEQTISKRKAYAEPSTIMTSKDQILEYLKYGEGIEKKYYEVIYGDTIEGVGSKNSFLSAQQIVNINDTVLSNIEQVLSPGTLLNVTYFQSPIDVVVKKESLRKEIVYPEGTIYQEDSTMFTNEEQIIQTAEVGSENVLFEETWINGYLVTGTRLSSIVTIQPQQEIIRVGTLEIPGNGTGTFRIPIDNANVTCRWGCYAGHRAVDLQNAYNRYGPIYAADRGTVYEVGYNGINGHYIVIDHGNTGYRTYYGHMNKASDLVVGDRVDKGDIIGQIGKTGKASGPHVHFFIMLSSNPSERLDPCKGFIAC